MWKQWGIWVSASGPHLTPSQRHVTRWKVGFSPPCCFLEPCLLPWQRLWLCGIGSVSCWRQLSPVPLSWRLWPWSCHGSAGGLGIMPSFLPNLSWHSNYTTSTMDLIFLASFKELSRMAFRSSSNWAHLCSAAGGIFNPFKVLLTSSFAASSCALNRLSVEIWGALGCLLALVLFHRLMYHLHKFGEIALCKVRSSALCTWTFLDGFWHHAHS